MAHSKTRANDGKITYPPGVKEISDKISKEEMVRRLKVSEHMIIFWKRFQKARHNENIIISIFLSYLFVCTAASNSRLLLLAFFKEKLQERLGRGCR